MADETGREPTCLALIVCDCVYIDPATGKHSILGALSSLRAQFLPAAYARLAVYAVLADGRGVCPIEVRVVPPEEGGPVSTHSAEFHFDDPLRAIEMTLQMEQLTFNSAGTYWFQLWSGGMLLAERRLNVIVAESSPPGR